MPDLPISAEASLLDVEARLDHVDASLLAGDLDGLQTACGELRRAALVFMNVIEQPARPADRREPALRQRIAVVAQRLDAQRTNLARRSTVVSLTLASIMGPQADVTYSLPAGRRAFGTAAAH